MKFRKKLIEVALPLEAINRASVRENYIYRGNPSAIHKWWAQRPLAAARAVIFSQLVDDPSEYVDTLKSDDKLRRKAERVLRETHKAWVTATEVKLKADEAGIESPDPGPEPTLDQIIAEQDRDRLFKIIEELVHWENMSNETVLDKARAEILESWQRTCTDNADHPRAKELFDRNKLPSFHDPFAGGGTLPLEAQRLGLHAYASDLNPVAVLINKAMIELPPKFAGMPPVNPDWQSKSAEEKGIRVWSGAAGLAEDVRYYGKWMRDKAEERIGHLYPKVKITQEMAIGRPDLKKLVGKELTVVAWLWARTVKSPNPAFRQVDVPLASTFMVSTKAGKEVYVDPVIENDAYWFSVKLGKPRNLAKVKAGTKVGKASFACILSDTPISPEYIREQGRKKRIGARMMAIVAESSEGRVYLPPTQSMESIADTRPAAGPNVEFFQQALGFRIGNYGFTQWSDLFTPRQLVALTTLGDLIADVRFRIKSDAAIIFSDGSSGADYVSALADAISIYLAFAIDKYAIYGNSLVPWYAKENRPSMLFSQQVLSMVWDYTEVNPFSSIGGSFIKASSIIAEALEGLPSNGLGGVVCQNDAASSVSKDCIVSTDPPYYDNIGYADLSDFFYVWLRRSLKSVVPGLFDTVAVPKSEELVATPDRHGGAQKAEAFFLRGMTRAMQNIAQFSHPFSPVTIYYAFKQSENDRKIGLTNTGWDTFLAAVIEAGFAITGTWPMRTERTGRVRDAGSNALASSIVLVCRQRTHTLPSVTRRELVSALRSELPEALRHLQRGNIAPVDLAQAAIGPGMAVYTRYEKVLDAEGKPLAVRDALALINQTLDEVLAEQEGDFDPDTRFALTWFDQFGFDEGDYGTALVLSQAKNTSVDEMADPRTSPILEAKAGKVRLFRPEELEPDWSPESDLRLTVWDMVHHLIRVLEKDGETAAATIVAKLGARAETARELCYRLYTMCERKKRAAEALSYNGLVQSWPEIIRLASQSTSAIGGEQQDMFD